MPKILVPALLLVLLALPRVAEAALIVVDTLDNEDNADGDCSLREAITAANTNTARDGCPAGNSTGQDTIFIAVTGTLPTNGSLGLPAITERLTILGNAGLVIQATGGSTLQRPIFTVNMTNASHGFELEGNGMTIRGGVVGGRGGAALYLRSAGVVKITDVAFENNRACDVFNVGICGADDTNRGSGGAIGFSTAVDEVVNRLELRGCRFSGNSATAWGGAIALMTANNFYRHVELVMERTTLIDNRARDAGALAWISNEDAVLRRSVIAGNVATKAYGAVYGRANYAPAPRWRLSNVLVTDNHAAATDLENATGGITLFSVYLSMSYSTIAHNTTLAQSATSSGGLWISIGPHAITHSAIADNLPVDCWGLSAPPANVTSYSFDSDGSCGFAGASDLPAASALMSGLGSFLGQSLTALPSVHSPMIDGGTTGPCLDVDGNSVTVDLHGNPRPVSASGGTARCDIGAFEAPGGYSFLFGDGFEGRTTIAW